MNRGLRAPDLCPLSALRVRGQKNNQEIARHPNVSQHFWLCRQPLEARKKYINIYKSEVSSLQTGFNVLESHLAAKLK